MLSPLVIEALKSLSARVNVSTGLTHPIDESAAKELFKMLHKEAEQLPGSDVTMWAVSNGWQDEDARKLGELAEKIGNGGRVVVKHKDVWAPDIMAQIRARASA